MIPSVNIVNILLFVSSVRITTGVAPIGFKSAVKCKEYETRHFGQQPAIDRNDFLFPDQVRAKPKQQNVQGNPAKFPFSAVVITSDPDAPCGGILISERFVLTAGYCASGRNPPESVIFQDKQDKPLNLNSTDLVHYAVKQGIRHPEYKANPVYNDIGLIELEKPLQFNDHLYPACLQVSRIIRNNDWIVNMWRQDKDLDFFTIKATEFAEDKCQERFSQQKRKSPYGVIAHLQICILEVKYWSRIDFREIPTALLTTNRNNNGYIIIGVPSTGFPLPDLPQIYTRVSSYIDWIESQVWPDPDPVVGCNNYRWKD